MVRDTPTGTETVFLPTKEVCRRVGFTKRHIDRLISWGRFPASIRLGHRTVVWREDEVRRWQIEREIEGLIG